MPYNSRDLNASWKALNRECKRGISSIRTSKSDGQPEVESIFCLATQDGGSVPLGLGKSLDCDRVKGDVVFLIRSKEKKALRIIAELTIEPQVPFVFTDGSKDIVFCDELLPPATSGFFVTEPNYCPFNARIMNSGTTTSSDVVLLARLMAPEIGANLRLSKRASTPRVHIKECVVAAKIACRF